MLRRFTCMGGALGLAAAGSALAQTAGAACTDDAGIGFGALGAAFGYFLTYSIRHGSKTQDVFKSFFGALGVTGGATTTLLVPEACRFALLVSYGAGALLGFAAFALLALLLALVYSNTYNPDQVPSGGALFAETLAKVMLGEDFRPPAKKP